MKTSITVIIIGIIYILHNNKVQHKLHEELDRVISSNRLITTADKSSLIYTQAVVNGVQYFTRKCIAYLHRRYERYGSNGHKIRKGQIVVAKISCLLYNEKVFPNARQFIPERWIDEKGKLRECLGESLARMKLFIIASNSYNSFKVIPSDLSGKLPSMKKNPGNTISVDHYTIKVVNRHI